mgnify:CR=1 FL=1
MLLQEQDAMGLEVMDKFAHYSSSASTKARVTLISVLPAWKLLKKNWQKEIERELK